MRHFGPALSTTVEDLGRAVIEASADCVKVISLDGRLEFMNQNGMCIMHVQDFYDIAGKDWGSLWPEGERARIERTLAEARTGRTSRFQGQCPTAAGVMKWWDVQVSPIYNAEGAVTAFLSVSRDISELKDAQARLEAALAQAAAASESKEQVLSRVGDELRLPAASVIGFADLVSDSPRLGEPERTQVRAIAETGRRMLALVNDLLRSPARRTASLPRRYEFELCLGSLRRTFTIALQDAAAARQAALEALGAFAGLELVQTGSVEVRELTGETAQPVGAWRYSRGEAISWREPAPRPGP